MLGQNRSITPECSKTFAWLPVSRLLKVWSDGKRQSQDGKNYPSPPTSISPVPPQVWHSPLPPHMEQEDSSPNAAWISSPAGFPLPWQPAQFPSPGESQLWQVRVAMPHLPLLAGDSELGFLVCQTDLVPGIGLAMVLIGTNAHKAVWCLHFRRSGLQPRHTRWFEKGF